MMEEAGTKYMLIIFAPLIGVIFNSLLLLREKLLKSESEHLTSSKLISGIFSSFVVFLSFVFTLSVFGEEPKKIEIFTWIPLEGIKVSFAGIFDNLSKTALLYITGVSTLIHIYSIGYMSHDRAFLRYFLLLNLFVFFMIQIVTADNLIQLFLGWEGVGLCSYLLIGFWYSDFQNARAGFKAFITNRIGDFGFIVGIALFLVYTGGLDYSYASKLLPEAVFITAFFLFMGAMGKSAQGPLWLWLPDAMRGPTPVSALIHAATMVTAGVYMVVRLGDIFLPQPSSAQLVFWTGIITALLMGFFGIFERDIKRILAFSTLSQLGLMFVGASTNQPYTGIFHVFEHSFFKAALFLISGILMHEFDDETDIYKLRERRPAEHGLMLSAFGFLICSLAMSGVFPFSGFWSKESIIHAAAQRFGDVGAYLMLLASFLTPIYMFRAFFIVFGGQKWKITFSPKHEGGAFMFFPVLVLVILSVIGGVFNVGAWLGEKYGYAVHHTSAVGGEHHISGLAKLVINPFFVHVVVASAIVIAYLVWGKGKEIEEKGIGRVLWRKFYLNEVEEGVFIGGAKLSIAVIFHFLERTVIEGFYFLISVLSRAFGFMLSVMHGGEPAKMLLYFIIGILIVILVV